MQIITFGNGGSNNGLENGYTQVISLAPTQQTEAQQTETQEAAIAQPVSVFSKALEQIKSNYKVLREVLEVVVFEASGKFFAVSNNGNELVIYQCFKDTHDYTFLPGFKTGKTFRAVSNFVAARTAA